MVHLRTAERSLKETSLCVRLFHHYQAIFVVTRNKIVYFSLLYVKYHYCSLKPGCGGFQLRGLNDKKRALQCVVMGFDLNSAVGIYLLNLKEITWFKNILKQILYVCILLYL